MYSKFEWFIARLMETGWSNIIQKYVLWKLWHLQFVLLRVRVLHVSLCTLWCRCLYQSTSVDTVNPQVRFISLFNLYLSRWVSMRQNLIFSRESWPRGIHTNEGHKFEYFLYVILPATLCMYSTDTTYGKTAFVDRFWFCNNAVIFNNLSFWHNKCNMQYM